MQNAEALALSLVLIAWAGSMRAATGTWLHPAAFFPLWWCFAGILPLIFAPEEPVGANAVLWLIGASIAVSIGAIAGNGGLHTKLAARESPPTDRELFALSTIVVVSIVLGIGSNIAFVAAK